MYEGVVSKDGAKEIINKYLDIECIKKNNKICYAACTELPDFTVKYFRVNDYSEETGTNITKSFELLYTLEYAKDDESEKYSYSISSCDCNCIFFRYS